MYCTCYCINSVSHQMLSAGILGHSPVDEGFCQSYQSQMPASYPYSTPLGPLSPFAAVSGSLPVSYQYLPTIFFSAPHTATFTPSPLTLTLSPPFPHPSHSHWHLSIPSITPHTHTVISPFPHPSHSHCHLSIPSSLTLTELWSRSPTTHADCQPWYWLHLYLHPSPVYRHTITLPLWAGP